LDLIALGTLITTDPVGTSFELLCATVGNNLEQNFTA
jgi:hypothetical protein